MRLRKRCDFGGISRLPPRFEPGVAEREGVNYLEAYGNREMSCIPCMQRINFFLFEVALSEDAFPISLEINMSLDFSGGCGESMKIYGIRKQCRIIYCLRVIVNVNLGV